MSEDFNIIVGSIQGLIIGFSIGLNLGESLVNSHEINIKYVITGIICTTIFCFKGV